MRPDDQLLMVQTGGRRYALVRRDVRALVRDASTDTAIPLASLLGELPYADEPFVIAVAGPAGLAIRVHDADLHGSLAQLSLPAWLAAQSHPAISGLVLDADELIPMVDLAQLTLQIGHAAS